MHINNLHENNNIRGMSPIYLKLNAINETYVCCNRADNFGANLNLAKLVNYDLFDTKAPVNVVILNNQSFFKCFISPF